MQMVTVAVFGVLILGLPVVSGATQCAEASSFTYPVDRSSIEGGAQWQYRLNGQSHGSLANNKSTGQHIGEDWNWGYQDQDFGKPVLAIGNGRAVRIWPDTSRNSWGKAILIEHWPPPGAAFLAGNGQRYPRAYSFYAHLERIDVDDDECVEKGQLIGTVGDANGFYRPEVCGKGCYPHLHFELRVPQNLDDDGLRAGSDGRGPGYLEERLRDGQVLSGAVSPVEFIENNFQVGGQYFSVWVHPYEPMFEYSPLANWSLEGEGRIFPEVGHGSYFFLRGPRVEGNVEGNAVWQPTIPVSGYYKIAQRVPSHASINSSLPSTLEYLIRHHIESDQSSTYTTRSVIDVSQHLDDWAHLVDAENPSRSSFYLRTLDSLGTLDAGQVSLETDPASESQFPADTMRFTYVGAKPAEFVDVQDGHWAHPYVERLFAQGVIDRSVDWTFRPEALISRARFLELVVRGRYGEISVSETLDGPPLLDVPVNSWYAPYVQFALDEGWDIQCAQGFCPEERVTRGWAAQLLRQVFPRVSQWHFLISLWPFGRNEPADSILACRLAGVMEGRVEERFDGVLDPSHELQRAEAAKVVAVAKYGKGDF